MEVIQVDSSTGLKRYGFEGEFFATERLAANHGMQVVAERIARKRAEKNLAEWMPRTRRRTRKELLEMTERVLQEFRTEMTERMHKLFQEDDPFIRTALYAMDREQEYALGIDSLRSEVVRKLAMDGGKLVLILSVLLDPKIITKTIGEISEGETEKDVLGQCEKYREEEIKSLQAELSQLRKIFESGEL